MIFFAWLVLQPAMHFNQLTLGIIIVLQVAALIRFVQKTNRALAQFFLSIRHGDLSMTFHQASAGYTFHALEESMLQVLEAYRQVKIEKEAQYQFLQLLVGQLPIGILSLEGQELVLINQTAAGLLHTAGTREWKKIQAQHPVFIQELENLGDHGRKLITLENEAGTVHLAVEVTTSHILGKPHRLITLQDIRTEIEQKEIEAWHKLIRILTHEIMNSVTPIASLTETMQAMLTSTNGIPRDHSHLSPENMDDIRYSFNTIHKRSEGLLSFVDKYRTLSRVPRPVLAQVNVQSFIHHMATLLTPDLLRQNIEFITQIDDRTSSISCDAALIEQVIINLVTNSTHALQERPAKKIMLLAYSTDRHTILEVTDNGKGIPEKELNDIFIPFFSTKKEGTGIGLSLSKQIMSLHEGSIRVQSMPGQKTSFYLYFKKAV
jgi:nitrogen fixation/metabolism regulation signal transduction histidine kinase